MTVNVYRKAFAEHLEWLVTMAMTPGWWQHSRLRARLKSRSTPKSAGCFSVRRARLARLAP